MITQPSGLGVGQTWQLMGAARVLGTVYTNTTGKPIQICVYLSSATAIGTLLTVNGVQMDAAFTSASVNNGVHAIVPPNATYVVNASGATISTWCELR